MKRVLLVWIALSLSVFSLLGQNRPIHTLMLEPIRSDKLEFKDDSCQVKFNYNESNGEICVKVYNNTSKRAYIEWENARLDGGRVVFGDDSRISMRNPKVDESIPAKSFSMYRSILSENWVGSETINNPVSPKQVRTRFGKIISVTIPVRFGKGEAIDYQFKISIYSFNPVKIDKISVGMKAKEVKAILGKPDAMDVDPWGFASTKADWFYAGNAVIYIRNGVVDEIVSLKKFYTEDED